MPAVREYIVRQVREVRVRAESPTDAVKLAEVPLSMSDQDNRGNHHPIPVEKEISAETPF